MTFFGLDSPLTYDFQIFASRLVPSTTDARNSVFSITDINGMHSYTLQATGQGIGAGGYNGNNDEFAYLNGIVPNGSSTITLTLDNGAGSTFAYINALSFTAVPEPVSVGIAAGADCLALVALRGRRA